MVVSAAGLSWLGLCQYLVCQGWMRRGWVFFGRKETGAGFELI